MFKCLNLKIRVKNTTKSMLICTLVNCQAYRKETMLGYGIQKQENGHRKPTLCANTIVTRDHTLRKLRMGNYTEEIVNIYLKLKNYGRLLISNKDHLDYDTYSNTDNDNRNYGQRDNYIQSERQQFNGGIPEINNQFNREDCRRFSERPNSIRNFWNRNFNTN